MTVTRKPPRRRGPPVTVETEKVEVQNREGGLDAATAAKIARLEQSLHDVRGHQQQRIAAEVLGSKAQGAPLPRWATTLFAATGGIVSLAAVAGIVLAVVNSYAGTRVDSTTQLARIVTLESRTAELPALGSRVQTIENTLATATRIRDQQQQGTADRLRSLEQADQAGAERVVTLAQTLATIAARIEDMLRRQEALERRLDRSGYLPPAERGSEQAPAIWLGPRRRAA